MEVVESKSSNSWRVVWRKLSLVINAGDDCRLLVLVVLILVSG